MHRFNGMAFFLPLFYLSMTSGLPPGSVQHEISTLATASTSLKVTDKVLLVNPPTTPLLNREQSVPQKETNPTEDSNKLSSSFNMTNIRDELGSDRKSISPSSVTQEFPTSTATFSSSNKEGNVKPIAAPPPHFQPPSALTAFSNTSKVRLRGDCNDTNQCVGEFTVCRQHVCNCQPGYLPRQDNGDLCGHASLYQVPLPSTDPTMIGVVIGLIFMSVTLCVVLRLFAKARFRENRTIFNTPNPRLMNASLLGKGGKALLRGNSAPRSRRGSTASARSGLDPISPTSPLGDHPIHSHSHHDNGNGNAVPLSGSSSGRSGRPQRQMSTDTVDSTPSSSRHGGPPHKQRDRMRHQDSIASNV